MRINYRILRIFTVCAVFFALGALASPTRSQSDPDFIIIGFPPVNDDFVNAQTLVLNKRTTTLGWLSMAGREPLETTDPDLTSCNMYATVWYKFTAPFSGKLALSTAGSRIYIPGWSTSDTKIAVYTGTTLSNLVQVVCNDDYSGLLGEIPSLQIVGGTTYYVRVGAFTPTALTGGWYKTIAVILDALDFDPLDFQNTSFDADLAGNWKLTKNFNGDMRVCAGDCEFKFVGGPGELTKLQQVRLWPSGVLLARLEHILRVRFEVNTSPSPNLKLQVTVNYSDGTPPTKASVTVMTEHVTDYLFLTFASFASPNVKKVKLVFLNKAGSGTAYIDHIYVDYDGGLLRNTPLPLPAPSK